MKKTNLQPLTEKRSRPAKLAKTKPAKLPAKRPWNRVDLPVYSISSTDGKGQFNMHIITYVTAISMQPKRFVCGVYKGTKTLANITAHPNFVLQLLAGSQYRLMALLGRKSGHTIDKIALLQKRGELDNWHGFPVLKNSLALMEMKVPDTYDGGDHQLCLCDVVAYKNTNPGKPLTLDILRAHKLIRI